MTKHSSTLAVFAAMALSSIANVARAQETPGDDRPGEAYYYYCLGRMDEMQMQVESAIQNYERAAQIDPAAAYPHVALADLYRRTRQVDKALESAKKAVELGRDVAAAHRILGKLYDELLRSAGNPDLAPVAIQAFRDTVRLEPSDVESRSRLARLLLAVREPDEAKVHLEEVVRLEPGAYYEMYLLAQIRQGEGDNAGAIQLLKQSLAVEPRQPEAREALVSLLSREQRFDELADVYRSALVDDPQDVEARIRFADALANSGQLPEAAAEFEGALEGDPANVIATVGLAMVRRELKEYEEAERLLNKALQAEPSHVLARATLAGIYEDTRQLAKAIEQWKKLVDLPLAGEQGNARRAEYWAHLGFDYGELERHEESVDAFARARELASQDERYDAFYVQSLLGAGRAKEARASVEDALTRHPDSMRLKILETRVLAENGEEKRALQKALAMSDGAPDDEMLTLAVVELYQRAKDYASAERFLGERLERKPDSVGLLFQLGAVLERQGKFDDAEAKFRKVLELDPDSAPTLNYLGYMLADRGVQLDQSLEYVKQALAADPHNGAYLDSLGWVYFKMGNLDLAEDNLLKALASLRLTGVVYDHLGDLYFRKGNLERAVQYWQKALDQEDDELEKDAVERKIEEATSPR